MVSTCMLGAQHGGSMTGLRFMYQSVCSWNCTKGAGDGSGGKSVPT